MYKIGDLVKNNKAMAAMEMYSKKMHTLEKGTTCRITGANNGIFEIRRHSDDFGPFLSTDEEIAPVPIAGI